MTNVMPIRRQHRPLWASLAASVLLHAAALLLLSARPTVETVPALRPVERFVKRLPTSRRPLARRQVPQDVRRPLARRRSTQSAPVAAVAPAPLTSQRLPLQGVIVPLVSAPPPPPDLPVQPLVSIPTPAIGPTFRAGALHGERVANEQIDLKVELLDINAMDTGQHRAMVVVDPIDRRALSGYLYLTGVYSQGLERAEQESPVPRRRSNFRPDGQPLRQLAERETLQGLADRMSAHTGVRTQVRQSMGLDDPALVEAPFVLLTVNNTFEFAPAEAANLGRYFAAGGFLYAEVVLQPQLLGGHYQFDIPALRELIRAAFRLNEYREGRDWAFERLDQNHSLYHCYYDIDSLPRGFWDWTYGYHEIQRTSPEYLEGIRMGDRLVGLYSQRDFSDLWAGEAELIREHDEASNLVNGKFMTGCEELPAYDLGVNVLVYALTREGSLAQKLVAAE